MENLKISGRFKFVMEIQENQKKIFKVSNNTLVGTLNSVSLNPIILY